MDDGPTVAAAAAAAAADAVQVKSDLRFNIDRPDLLKRLRASALIGAARFFQMLRKVPLEVNSIALLKYQQSFYSSVGHPVVLETLLKSLLKFQQSY